MRKIFRIVLVMLFVAIVCAGCQPSVQIPDEPTKDTLIVAVTADINDFDAQGVNSRTCLVVRSQVYEPLLVTDENMDLVPALAESWEYEDDTTIVFNLRQGVIFHNGAEMTSEDVVWSLQRSCDSPYSGPNIEAVDKDSIEAIDKYSVRVGLKQPFAPILRYLTRYDCAIMCKEAFESAGDKYDDEPVGTGPFKLTKWVRGDRFEFARHDEYWGEKSIIKDLVMRIIPDASNRTIEVETGGVDIAYEILPNDANRLERDGKANVVRAQTMNSTYIGFNCLREPFDNVKVRQAISHAVDVEALVESVYQGAGVLATAPIAPNVFGYKEGLKLPEYDLEKAKALMVEAGFPDGFETVIWLSDRQTEIDTAEILHNSLGKIGITAEVNVLERATYLNHIVEGTIDMFILGFTNNEGDGDRGLYLPFHSSTPGPQNTGRYSNPEVDALLEKGRVSIDDEERIKAYHEAQEIIVKEVPRITLLFEQNISATTKEVKGFVGMPTGYHKLSSVYFD